MKVRHNMKMSHGFLINLHFTDSVTDKERNIYICIFSTNLSRKKITSFIKIQTIKSFKKSDGELDIVYYAYY